MREKNHLGALVVVLVATGCSFMPQKSKQTRTEANNLSAIEDFQELSLRGKLSSPAAAPSGQEQQAQGTDGAPPVAAAKALDASEIDQDWLTHCGETPHLQAKLSLAGDVGPKLSAAEPEQREIITTVFEGLYDAKLGDLLNKRLPAKNELRICLPSQNSTRVYGQMTDGRNDGSFFPLQESSWLDGNKGELIVRLVRKGLKYREFPEMVTSIRERANPAAYLIPRDESVNYVKDLKLDFSAFTPQEAQAQANFIMVTEVCYGGGDCAQNPVDFVFSRNKDAKEAKVGFDFNFDFNGILKGPVADYVIASTSAPATQTAAAAPTAPIIEGQAPPPQAAPEAGAQTQAAEPGPEEAEENITADAGIQVAGETEIPEAPESSEQPPADEAASTPEMAEGAKPGTSGKAPSPGATTPSKPAAVTPAAASRPQVSYPVGTIADLMKVSPQKINRPLDFFLNEQGLAQVQDACKGYRVLRSFTVNPQLSFPNDYQKDSPKYWRLYDYEDRSYFGDLGALPFKTRLDARIKGLIFPLKGGLQNAVADGASLAKAAVLVGNLKDFSSKRYTHMRWLGLLCYNSAQNYKLFFNDLWTEDEAQTSGKQWSPPPAIGSSLGADFWGQLPKTGYEPADMNLSRVVALTPDAKQFALRLYMRRPLPFSYLSNVFKGNSDLLGKPENIQTVIKSVNSNPDGSRRVCKDANGKDRQCIIRSYVDLVGVIDAQPGPGVRPTVYRELTPQERQGIKPKKILLGTENDSGLCKAADKDDRNDCPLNVYVALHTQPASVGIVGDLGAFAFDGPVKNVSSAASRAFDALEPPSEPLLAVASPKK